MRFLGHICLNGNKHAPRSYNLDTHLVPNIYGTDLSEWGLLNRINLNMLSACKNNKWEVLQTTCENILIDVCTFSYWTCKFSNIFIKTHTHTHTQMIWTFLCNLSYSSSIIRGVFTNYFQKTHTTMTEK